MGIDENHREMDGNCREIDLIRGSHPPQRNREIKRERERERERDTLMHEEIGLFFIDISYWITIMYLYDTSSNVIGPYGSR